MREGAAVATGRIEEVRDQARRLGWAEVAPRRGDPTVSVLRLRTKTAAHPNSLSVSYGLGSQPLHTDGAHLTVPPQLLVLACEEGSATATRWWHPRMTTRPRPSSALAHGMFLVRSGAESFFAPANDQAGFRFDPGCMTPCDARAQTVVRFFDEVLDEAAVVEWSAPNQLLVIDNRHSLHARSAVMDPRELRVLTRVTFQTEIAK